MAWKRVWDRFFSMGNMVLKCTAERHLLWKDNPQGDRRAGPRGLFLHSSSLFWCEKKHYENKTQRTRKRRRDIVTLWQYILRVKQMIFSLLRFWTFVGLDDLRPEVTEVEQWSRAKPSACLHCIDALLPRDQKEELGRLLLKVWQSVYLCLDPL